MGFSEVVIDTSSLINLLATAHEVEIVSALNWSLFVSSYVRDETRFLSSPPDADGRRQRVPADLTPLFAAQRLTVCNLSDAWLEVFIRCAEHLPDADASAVALAAHMGTTLVTDDP